MMRSLYSGVAGLRTHQTKMDVLGNNIANVNTTSFKSQSITFSDLMYQTTQTASGATETKGGVNARQIGLGAKSGAIATAIESQGATQTTNNPFDIMITGKSFFVVNNGKENLYTRDGSFYVDGAGNLAMQSNGYLVQGWAAQEDKTTGEVKINRNGGLSSLQIMSADNSTYSPASTTAALYSGNIDDHDTNVTSDDGKTITLEFYDNKGYLYTGKFTLKDTGEDHLFSVELTDIIDSDGNTINKTLADGTKIMDHISFGDTESVDAAVDKAYEVVVGATTSVVNLQAGATEYEKVPNSGTLSDLMNSSKSSYAGILEKVYGITDDMVTGGTKGYSKNSEYSIDDNGILTITYDEDVLTEKTTGYTYSTTATNSYYVSNDDSGLGYPVPSSTSGFMNKASASLQTTLKTVFDVPATDLTTYMGSSKYLYEFTSVEAGKDTFKIYRSPSLEEAKNATATSKGNLSKFYDDFVGLESGDGTYPGISSYTDPIYYKYVQNETTKEKELTVYGSKLSDATTTKPVTAAQIAALSDLDPDTMYSFASLDNAQRKEMAQLLIDANIISDAATSYTVDNSVATAVKVTVNPGTASEQVFVYDTSTSAGLDEYIAKTTLLDNAIVGEKLANLDSFMNTGAGGSKYTNFTIESLSGTNGILFYTSEPTTVVDESNILYKGNPFSVTYEAKEDNYPVSTPDEIGGIYINTTDGSAYVLTGEEETVADYSAEMLLNVFNIEKAKHTASLKVSLKGNSISFYQTQTTKPDLNSKYAATVDGDDTLKYVTTEKIEKWKNLPNTGNISTLLESASGDYRGLLSKVYNISDADARAFGSDGTYTINADGSIALSTGSHTIQLVFDPANGALTTANDDPTGLVNIVFDQEIEGLEAFGYQKQSTDGADAVLGRVTVDFSSVTNYNTSGSSTIKAVKGDKKSLNTGRAVGEMNGVTVSTDGQIYATYSNGQTKLLGQIASAEFANASGLSKEGDNLYASTLNSGEATIQDITTDGGYMNTGVLEMSNVDLSKEFTEMITTQRGFQANSRIITVSDTLLEELTNLKR